MSPLTSPLPSSRPTNALGSNDWNSSMCSPAGREVEQQVVVCRVLIINKMLLPNREDEEEPECQYLDGLHKACASSA